ncbi:inositol-trisphosphate 3-kinase A-like [Centroberyx affinis]|uniref:inositol-trisphosphate 3-kinase A-like n=1 Tax=Centroberyx affinis TaxID=166261 RepID=UPI003A5BC503
MDAVKDHYMEGEEKEEENEIANESDDVSVGLSDETLRQLTLGEGPPGGCRRARARPTLRSTKSFPPYSQCIGGLGEEGERENEMQPSPEEVRLHAEAHLRSEEVKSEEVQLVQGRSGAERREDVETSARRAREELRAKWRGRRRERLGGSHEADMEGWERRERWSGERRTEEARGGEGSEGADGKGKQQIGRESVNSGTEGAEGEERKSSDSLEVEGEREGGGKKGTKGEGPPRKREGSSNQWSTPHPILSKLLHSSSSSSTSSINLSSAESDEVFSEGEDAGSKRKTFRKCHSWKTLLTMMHWSLRRQSSWVQLAGHQGNFQLSERGEVLKLYSEVEAKCLDWLMRDPLRPFVPQYHGLISRGEHSYICLDDLLSGLKTPVIMDCKMGVRTYQEEEMVKARTKPSLRSDMYQKMLKVDPAAPSAEEHAQKGVTKWRYLQWKDATSSTSTLGFRIEGVMMENGSVQRDFRKILTLAQATEALLFFTRSQLHILKAYHSRLQALSDALKDSAFFRTHEVIGSSLLFVHDDSSKANVWMIDFGKTTPVPDTGELRHNVPWDEGSREDGYLIGLASLTSSLSQAITKVSWRQEESAGGENSGLTEGD